MRLLALRHDAFMASISHTLIFLPPLLSFISPPEQVFRLSLLLSPFAFHTLILIRHD